MQNAEPSCVIGARVATPFELRRMSDEPAIAETKPFEIKKPRTNGSGS